MLGCFFIISHVAERCKLALPSGALVWILRILKPTGSKAYGRQIGRRPSNRHLTSIAYGKCSGSAIFPHLMVGQAIPPRPPIICGGACCHFPLLDSPYTLWLSCVVLTSNVLRLRSGCAVASCSLRSFSVLRRVSGAPRSLDAGYARVVARVPLRSSLATAPVAALPSRAYVHRPPSVRPSLSGAPLAQTPCSLKVAGESGFGL